MGAESSVDSREQDNKLLSSWKISLHQWWLNFIFTQPFDLLKTRAQASLLPSSIIRAPLLLYHQHGIKGLYYGGKAQLIMSLAKEFYRVPLRGALKNYYHKCSAFNNSPDLINLALALSMASIDTLFLSALERLKVWQMTVSSKNTSILSGKTIAMRWSTGVGIFYIRNIASWSSYLMVEERLRQRITHHSEQKDLRTTQQFAVGFGVGIVNSLLTLPFDNIKTQMQQQNPSTKKSICSCIKSIYRTAGVMGLYAGWKYRLPQYILSCTITAGNLHRVEKLWACETPET